MLQYSEEFRFEEAMKLRDRIKTIEKSQIHTGMDLASNIDLDLFAIRASKDKAVIVRMFFREGKLASSNHDYLKINQTQLEIDLNEAYKRAIINYYDNEIPLLPKEIIVADEITQEIDELQEFIKDRFEKIFQ